MKFLVLNGPNLNLLGAREPDVYGSKTLADLEAMVAGWGQAMGAEVEAIQSNHEGDLLDNLHRSGFDGMVINPGAYTHTSRALADAVASIPTPVVEVHISNVKEREEWRKVSYIGEVANYSIYGRGLAGYRDAMRHLVNLQACDVVETSYGDHPEQVADLRGTGRRMVVVVHGGFWRHEWKRDTMESLSVDLAERGFSSLNIEYRRIGAGGDWPSMGEDVRVAIEHSASIGRAPATISVLGHSSGAHLGMWAVERLGVEIHRMVAMAPVVDLERHALSQMCGAEEARSLLDQGVPDPMSPGDVKILLVHGEDDRHVPIDHSARLARAHGLEMLTTTEGHFELLDPTRHTWSQVIDVLGD